MLSIFPDLLFLAPLSALAIRMSVACVFALASYTHARNAPSLRWYGISVFEFVAALSLALGYFAQGGALVGILLIIVWYAFPSLRTYSRGTLFLTLVMCLSLLVTGPGAFAFDLPL